MVPEYPTNSNKSKEESREKGKNLAPVVDEPAAVRVKRKPNKFLKLIFKQDLNDIRAGLVKEYIEPKTRELSWSFIQAGIDLVTNTLRMMVYPDYKPTTTVPKLPAERYTYNNYYTSSSQAYANRAAPSMASEVSYDEFTYPTSEKAQMVLNELKNQIDACRYASVLDLYQLSKVSTSNYTLQDWGWTDLSFSEVRQTVNEEGQYVYIITLPKAKHLQR